MKGDIRDIIFILMDQNGQSNLIIFQLFYFGKTGARTSKVIDGTCWGVFCSSSGSGICRGKHKNHCHFNSVQIFLIMEQRYIVHSNYPSTTLSNVKSSLYLEKCCSTQVSLICCFTDHCNKEVGWFCIITYTLILYIEGCKKICAEAGNRRHFL